MVKNSFQMMYRQTKRQLCILSLCISTCVFLYIVTNYTIRKGPAYNVNRNSDELMTQDPISVARRREYEKKLLENLNIPYNKSKMDHDPKGIIVHNNNYDSIIGLSNRLLNVFSNAFKKQDHPARIITHIDLKGAPPKISYLKELMKFLKSVGVTGVLVEYEDMFPYWGPLSVVRSRNSYTRAEITELYKIALEYNLEYIPLVQTFGHLEFLLKLKEFSHLREVPHVPSAICPNHNETQRILTLLVDQILELHPGINWIHIGCDEVFQLGECEKCQKKLSLLDMSKDKLFLNHIHEIGNYIKKTYDITPIIWDDQLRSISAENIQASDIGNIEIMVWQYSPGILNTIKNNIWDKYHACFDGIWIASAFKGAGKPNSYLTDIGARLDNNKEWYEVYKMYKHAINFRGIVLTGWQRFDHFAVLCELLPQAIPSLIIITTYLRTQKSDHNTILDIGKNLGCSGLINMDLRYIEYLNYCSYPGSGALEIAQRLYMLENEISSLLKSNYMLGWMTDYNIKHKFSNPSMYDIGLQDVPVMIHECEAIRNKAKNSLTEIYDYRVIEEWLELNVDGKCDMLSKLLETRNRLNKITSWPRRPLNAGSKKGEL